MYIYIQKNRSLTILRVIKRDIQCLIIVEKLRVKLLQIKK